MYTASLRSATAEQRDLLECSNQLYTNPGLCCFSILIPGFNPPAGTGIVSQFGETSSGKPGGILHVTQCHCILNPRPWYIYLVNPFLAEQILKLIII